jgi:hypothetical protein
MPVAAFVVMSTREKMPGVFLHRYASGGEFAGDTWHESEADAVHQLAFEFGQDAFDWRDVPSDIEDEVKWAMNTLSDSNT